MCLVAADAGAQQLPELTAPVNDFANVIDPQSEAAIDALIRSLQRASSDVVVVAAGAINSAASKCRRCLHNTLETYSAGSLALPEQFRIGNQPLAVRPVTGENGTF